MFSLLNTKEGKGNHTARLCKFLDPLSKIFRSLQHLLSEGRYLFESGRVREGLFRPIGDRIAFPHLEPVRIRIRTGKD